MIARRARTEDKSKLHISMPVGVEIECTEPKLKS